jgi:hypothetical protein
MYRLCALICIPFGLVDCAKEIPLSRYPFLSGSRSMQQLADDVVHCNHTNIGYLGVTGKMLAKAKYDDGGRVGKNTAVTGLAFLLGVSMQARLSAKTLLGR